MMGKTPKTTAAHLSALIEVLEEEIDSLTSEELLAEIGSNACDAKKLGDLFDSILNSAGKSAKRKRLSDAQEGYKKASQCDESAKISNNVLMWPIDKKKALLEKLCDQDSSITMAARNDENSESDIDSILEDLIALGAIDSQGNSQ